MASQEFSLHRLHPGLEKLIPLELVCEKPFIFFVHANPEPDDLIRRSPDTNSTVTAVDADRNEPIRSMDLLEAQTWMPRVLLELTICGAGLTADIVR
jgi:hypothetical protein